MENKLKHLEFIQSIINRMSSNSFLIKGWCITLVAGIFALSVKDSNQGYVVIIFIPVIIFWILDGYYLSQERLFRSLYDSIRVKKDNKINFSMKTSSFKTCRNSWFCSMFSPTLLFFYTALIGAILATYSLIN